MAKSAKKSKSGARAKAARSKTQKKAKTARAKTPAEKAKSRKSAASKGIKQVKPIELYYWATPNGYKVSIMLEELKVPYVLRPVNIGLGDQFSPAFEKISPNMRMPAIVDPEGPGKKPISVFESGAILQYLGRKFGKFYPQDERKKVQVDEWLFWQVGGLGPMSGQNNHFRIYAKEQIQYAIDRYTNEVNRLYGVMNKRLASNKYLGGNSYSIADMASWGWVRLWKRQAQNIEDFPHLKRWFDELSERPAVKAGVALGQDLASAAPLTSDAAHKIMFGQRAR